VALNLKFDTSTTDGKIRQSIWDDFVASYDYVKKTSPVIRYPDNEFRMRGIPTYRQTIAWKNLIKMLGEDNFCTLNFELNYLRDAEVLSVNKFNEITKESKKLVVTFVCGYFWRFNEQRRYDMISFVVDNMLKKDITVNIWTEDDTLEHDFEERMEEKELDTGLRKKLHIHRRYHRFDIHYTLIENKDNREKTCVIMELPHTEAHLLRLETYLTFEQLKSFGCSAEKLMRVLNYHQKWNPFKSLFAKLNFALNI